jgi:hypothetical protein
MIKLNISCPRDRLFNNLKDLDPFGAWLLMVGLECNIFFGHDGNIVSINSHNHPSTM